MEYVESGMSAPKNQVACPICGCHKFGNYNGRLNARCAGCGAKERERLLTLVLHKAPPKSVPGKVYHFAPEAQMSKLLHEKYKADYAPADIDPSAYDWCDVPVQKIDLSKSLDEIEDGTAQGVIHSHVLEHIPGSLERLVVRLNRLISPGGFHIFQVPIHNGWYREDMNPDMPAKERSQRFQQHDHLRAFGSNDFEDRVLSLFDGFSRVSIEGLLTSADLEAAAIPANALKRFTGHSVFYFVKDDGDYSPVT